MKPIEEMTPGERVFWMYHLSLYRAAMRYLWFNPNRRYYLDEQTVVMHPTPGAFGRN